MDLGLIVHIINKKELSKIPIDSACAKKVIQGFLGITAFEIYWFKSCNLHNKYTLPHHL